MAPVIERIIASDKQDTDNFANLQRNRLAELKKIADKQRRGEAVDTIEIVDKLKRAGILTQKGNLAGPYKKMENTLIWSTMLI